MKKGFTLSEVLICLGIVGTVAALTIPATMRNYQKRVLTTQLQKTYSQISSAVQTIMDAEHVDNFYETTATTCPGNNCDTSVKYWFDNYFLPVKKDCQKGTDLCTAGNTADSYQNIDGDNAGGINSYCIQTSDGAAICGFMNPNNTCFSIVVDVNGPSAPNVTGRDVFSMDIHKDGSISDYSSGCADNSYGCSASQCNNGTGSIFNVACGCLTSIIESGWKMEY